MENTNKQFEYGLTIKNLTKTIGMVFIVSLVTLAIFGVGLQMGGAKTEYQALTPVAQKTYDSAIKTVCNAEKTLAQAKLMDFTNNALKLDPETVKELAIKRDMECAFKQAETPKTTQNYAKTSKSMQIIKEKMAHPEVQSGLNIDKLAVAVSYAETSGCKDGTAIKRNNCFGIMTWPNGKRTPKYYNSHKESFEDFKRIWSKSYKVFPTLKEARKWTGNDKPSEWLNTVKYYYNK